MKNLNVFAYDVNDFLKIVSKKGTESDITLFHRKDGDNLFTFLAPSRFPEKISSLTDCIYPADVALINGDNITKDLGEVIIALDLMGIRKGYFLLNDESRIDTIKKIASKTSLRDFGFFSGNAIEFIDILSREKHTPKFHSPTVVVDHFFKVKSVGTVALGFVLGGKIEKHQKLKCSYIGKEAQIRSIQVQDEDQDSAESGTRVGLALKNIEADELERGMFLSDSGFQYLEKFKGDLEIHPAVKQKPENSFEIFASDLMRYQRGFFNGGEIIMEKPVMKAGNGFVVATPGRNPRILGRIRPS